jgi:putative transposase
VPALHRSESGARRQVADPADYAWSSYRANAHGESGPILSPHPLYLALATEPAERLEAYRALFRTALDDAPLGDLRLALNQSQPLGNDRFYAEIEAVTGQRREPRKRGRPRKEPTDDSLPHAQQELPFE